MKRGFKRSNMTQGALVINQQLLQKGFDPDTKEFYNEVTRRIKRIPSQVRGAG